MSRREGPPTSILCAPRGGRSGGKDAERGSGGRRGEERSRTDRKRRTSSSSSPSSSSSRRGRKEGERRDGRSRGEGDEDGDHGKRRRRRSSNGDDDGGGKEERRGKGRDRDVTPSSSLRPSSSSKSPRSSSSKASRPSSSSSGGRRDGKGRKRDRPTTTSSPGTTGGRLGEERRDASSRRARVVDFSPPRDGGGNGDDRVGVGVGAGASRSEEILSDPDYPTLFRRGRRPAGGGVGGDGDDDGDDGGEGSVTRDVLKVLLNAMGFEPSSAASEEEQKQGGGTVTSAKPMTGGKKPAEDPTSVRDFALLQVAMGIPSSSSSSSAAKAASAAESNGARGGARESAGEARGATSRSDGRGGDDNDSRAAMAVEAFRLAALHVVRWRRSHSHSSSSSSSSSSSHKSTKFDDVARRAYMVLFVALRGFLVRIADDPALSDHRRGLFDRVEDSEGGVSSSSSRFTLAEGLLLDVVPLLTRFANGTKALEDKHAASFMKNFLHLDDAVRIKKRDRSKSKRAAMTEGITAIVDDDVGATAGTTTGTSSKDIKATAVGPAAAASSAAVVIVRDGLTELFVRQLASQEGWDADRIRKETGGGGGSSLSGATRGAAAACRRDPTRECLEASKGAELRRDGQRRALDDAFRRRRRRRLAEEGRASEGATSCRWDSDDDEEETSSSRRARAHRRGDDGARSWGPTAASVAAAADESEEEDDDVEDERVLRIDGCIYLSRVAARMTSSSSAAASAGGRRREESRGRTTNGSDGSNNNNAAARSDRKVSSRDAEDGDANDDATAAARDASSRTKKRRRRTSPPCPRLAAAPAAVGRASDDALARQRKTLRLAAYFFFHSLMEQRSKRGPGGAVKRKDLASAVLSSFLLAGKAEDCPVKIKTLMGLAAGVPLPPPRPSPSTARDGVDRRPRTTGPAPAPPPPSAPPADPDPASRSDGGGPPGTTATTGGRRRRRDARGGGGAPSPDRIKRCELLTLARFGFRIPEDLSSTLDPTAHVRRAPLRTTAAAPSDVVDVDETTAEIVDRVVHGPGYTHSSLCLLHRPTLIAAAACRLASEAKSNATGGEPRRRVAPSPPPPWAERFDEEEGAAKIVAEYMTTVRACVEEREKEEEEDQGGGKNFAGPEARPTTTTLLLPPDLLEVVRHINNGEAATMTSAAAAADRGEEGKTATTAGGDDASPPSPKVAPQRNDNDSPFIDRDDSDDAKGGRAVVPAADTDATPERPSLRPGSASSFSSRRAMMTTADPRRGVALHSPRADVDSDAGREHPGGGESSPPAAAAAARTEETEAAVADFPPVDDEGAGKDGSDARTASVPPAADDVAAAPLPVGGAVHRRSGRSRGYATPATPPPPASAALIPSATTVDAVILNPRDCTSSSEMTETTAAAAVVVAEQPAAGAAADEKASPRRPTSAAPGVREPSDPSVPINDGDDRRGKGDPYAAKPAAAVVIAAANGEGARFAAAATRAAADLASDGDHSSDAVNEDDDSRHRRDGRATAPPRRQSVRDGSADLLSVPDDTSGCKEGSDDEDDSGRLASRPSAAQRSEGQESVKGTVEPATVRCCRTTPIDDDEGRGGGTSPTFDEGIAARALWCRRRAPLTRDSETKCDEDARPSRSEERDALSSGSGGGTAQSNFDDRPTPPASRCQDDALSAVRADGTEEEEEEEEAEEKDSAGGGGDRSLKPTAAAGSDGIGAASPCEPPSERRGGDAAVRFGKGEEPSVAAVSSVEGASAADPNAVQARQTRPRAQDAPRKRCGSASRNGTIFSGSVARVDPRHRDEAHGGYAALRAAGKGGEMSAGASSAHGTCTANQDAVKSHSRPPQGAPMKTSSLCDSASLSGMIILESVAQLDARRQGEAHAAKEGGGSNKEEVSLAAKSVLARTERDGAPCSDSPRLASTTASGQVGSKQNPEPNNVQDRGAETGSKTGGRTHTQTPHAVGHRAGSTSHASNGKANASSATTASVSSVPPRSFCSGQKCRRDHGQLQCLGNKKATSTKKDAKDKQHQSYTNPRKLAQGERDKPMMAHVHASKPGRHIESKDKNRILGLLGYPEQSIIPRVPRSEPRRTVSNSNGQVQKGGDRPAAGNNTANFNRCRETKNALTNRNKSRSFRRSDGGKNTQTDRHLSSSGDDDYCQVRYTCSLNHPDKEQKMESHHSKRRRVGTSEPHATSHASIKGRSKRNNLGRKHKKKGYTR